MTELNNLAISSSQFVIFAQEPYLKNGVISGLDDRKFNVISYLGQDKIRACILTSKNCETLPLRQFCNGDLAVSSLKIKINGRPRKVIIASNYMPSESDILPPSREVENLTEYCKNEKIQFLMGCDANAHNIVWGSTDTSPKGDSLLEFILSSSLTILNRGNLIHCKG